MNASQHAAIRPANWRLLQAAFVHRFRFDAGSSPALVLAVCDGKPRDPSVLWHVNLCMTREEQVAAFASAGFQDACVVLELGNHLLVQGRVAP